jgi:hypothetical protein
MDECKMAELEPESEGITINRRDTSWVISLCENGHQFPTRIWGRSLLEWPTNWKRVCPHCGTDKWKVDLDFDYASALLREKKLDPDVFELLTHIQDAAKMAYAGDEAGALALVEAQAKPLLPFIETAIRHGGWPSAIVLIVAMLTSCTAEVVGTIDVKYLAHWGSVHATLEKPPLQVGRGRVEQTSEPLPEAGQTRQQRRQTERQTNKRLRQRAPLPSRK